MANPSFWPAHPIHHHSFDLMWKKRILLLYGSLTNHPQTSQLQIAIRIYDLPRFLRMGRAVRARVSPQVVIIWRSDWGRSASKMRTRMACKLAWLLVGGSSSPPRGPFPMAAWASSLHSSCVSPRASNAGNQDRDCNTPCDKALELHTVTLAILYGSHRPTLI